MTTPPAPTQAIRDLIADVKAGLADTTDLHRALTAFERCQGFPQTTIS